MADEKIKLKKVMIDHYKTYPGMMIQDMVKMIYQNEFAGGHFVSDEIESLNRLKTEYRSVLQKYREAGMNSNPVTELVFEDIGNSLCRVNLLPLAIQDDRPVISLETVNRFFVITANSTKGVTENFRQKLELFRQCCAEGELPFSIPEVDDYIVKYNEQGYPPVSHSEAYRSLYSPAYRVVNNVFRDFFGLFCRIDSLAKTKESQDPDKPVCIAIDGNCAAGKSELSKILGQVYDCNIFHMDDFFLRPEQKTQKRLLETGGNSDYERFQKEIIEGLKSREKFSYRKYNCGTRTLDTPVTVEPKKLNIIEGSYSMHPSHISFYDLKVFLSIGKEEQSRRILARNGPDMYNRFMKLWVPMENRYFKKFKIVENCDLVFQFK